MFSTNTNIWQTRICSVQIPIFGRQEYIQYKYQLLADTNMYSTNTNNKQTRICSVQIPIISRQEYVQYKYQ